jgi:hypothetical protein
VRRTRLTVAAALAASLLLAGCGGDDGDDGDDGGQTIGEGTELSSTWPLTGLEVEEGESSETAYPVYIVKIDNTYGSNPQVGLGSADLVVEELVEGGITRLAAFYHSELPEKVGPVRSMRLTDIDIAKPVDAELVASGAAPVTLRGLKAAGVRHWGMSNPAVVRESDGVHDTLYSVMADLTRLAEAAEGEERPADYLPWGEAADFPGGQKATSISAQMSGARTSEWKFVRGKYILQNGYMPADDRFEADTVITCTVRTSIAPYRDPAGNPVPISHFEGSGPVMVFHDGKVVRGTWRKETRESAITLETKAGEFKLPAGKVWIELIPRDNGEVRFR